MLDADSPSALLGLEVGQLKYLFDTDEMLSREPARVKSVVRWLDHVRNELAHLRPVPPGTLQEGLLALEAAGL